MIDIDFLPANYRQKNLRRSNRIVPIIVIVLLAISLTVVSSLQLRHQHQLKQLSAVSNSKYLRLKEIDHQLFQLQTRHHQATHEAELFSFVQCSVPSSRIIAEVVNRLPKTCEIEKLRITFEKRPRQQLAAQNLRRGPQSNQADEDKLLSAAQRDLKTLTQENSENQRVVNIEGFTTAPTELHRFVESLAQAGVFTSADLRWLDSSESQKSDTAEFLLRAIVTPLKTLKVESKKSAEQTESLAAAGKLSRTGVDR